LGGDEMSAMRSLTPLLRRSCTSGLFADYGRAKTVTPCFHFLRYGNEKLDWVCVAMSQGQLSALIRLTQQPLYL
jgi:hypothetical protein